MFLDGFLDNIKIINMPLAIVSMLLGFTLGFFARILFDNKKIVIFAKNVRPPILGCGKRGGFLDIIFGTMGGAVSLIAAFYGGERFGVLGFLIGLLVFWVMGYETGCGIAQCYENNFLILMITFVCFFWGLAFASAFVKNDEFLAAFLTGCIMGGIVGRRSGNWLNYTNPKVFNLFIILLSIMLILFSLPIINAFGI